MSQHPRGYVCRAATLVLASWLAWGGVAAAQVRPPQTARQRQATAEVLKLYETATKLRDEGRFRAAVPLVLRALEIDEGAYGPDSSEVATDLTNLGNLYGAMGELKRALEPLERALKIRTSRPESHALAPLLNNIAAVYGDMGDYERAEPLYLRALEVNERTFGLDSAGAANSLQGLGVLYSKMGQYEKAKPYYLRALRIVFDNYGEENVYAAATLDSLAGLYRNSDEAETAERLYLAALDIYSRVLPPDHPQVGTALNNLALLYHMQGKYAEAQRYYEAALKIAEGSLGPDHLEVAIDLSNLAALYEATGQEKALDTFARSLDIQQRNLGDIFSISSERRMQNYLASVQATFDLMFAAAAREKTPRAAEVALTWLLRRKAVILDTLVSFRAARSQLERDPSLAELADRLRFVRQRVSDLPLSPRGPGGEEGLARELAELGREAERLEERLNVALNRLVPGLRRDLTEVTAEGVRARLRPGSALAEFTRGRVFDFKATGKMRHWHPAHYYAFVVTPAPGGATRMLDLGEAAPIDRAIERLRANVIAFKDDWKAQKFAGDDPLKNERDEEASYREAAADLYKLLFAPVRKELGAAQTLYVSPDSQLNLLPFEALVDADGKYLIESFDLSYVSSGRELLAAPAEVARSTAVFAAPDYNMTAVARAQRLKESPAATPAPAAAPTQIARAQTRGGTWVELKGSAAEAADVKKALEGTAYGGVTCYIAQDALEERLKRVRSPRLLHISTHGFFPPESREQEPAELDLATGNIALVGQLMLRQAGDPLLESGLVLAGANRLGEAGRPEGLDDGWVTAEEIAQMDLRGTELVVLSACGTGLGAVSSGEGVYGLRRAFQLAGARGVVSTLFEVPDEDSARLMRDFYEGLKQQKPKSVALTEARLKLINERMKAGKSAHPFFWSGFVLTGGQN